MARLTSITVENYRSIGDPVQINLPLHRPLVLLGENNAGKSNLIKAIGLVLGQSFPNNYEPDDNEFFQRHRTHPISIEIEFAQSDPYGRGFTKVIWEYENGRDPPIFYRAQPSIYPNRDESFLSSEDRDSCICVVIEAERNLKYQLSYSSKWTLLSRLMHKFHKTLLEQTETKGELESLFEQVKQRFQLIPEFTTFLNELKEQVADFGGTMTHRLEVDFEAYNPVNFFHALRLHAKEGDEARTFDELGTGEQQILAMAFAHAYAKAFHGGVLLVVEEPESHLHPLAQDWLSQRLSKLAADGLQIIITTHSASFLDILNLEGIVLVKKDNTASTAVVQVTKRQLAEYCITTGAPADRVSPEGILGFYATGSTKEILEGFFAKAILLCEGPTEHLSLPFYFEKSGFNAAKEGLAIIPVHGKGNLAKWRRLFTCYEIPCYVVFDNDTSDDSKGIKRCDALVAAGIPDDQHQSLIKTTDWIIDKQVSIFGSDFEKVLRPSFSNYSQLEDEGRSQGVDSKPFLARYVAERLEYNEEDIGWKNFKIIVSKLRTLLGQAVDDDSPVDEEDFLQTVELPTATEIEDMYRDQSEDE